MKALLIFIFFLSMSTHAETKDDTFSTDSSHVNSIRYNISDSEHFIHIDFIDSSIGPEIEPKTVWGFSEKDALAILITILFGLFVIVITLHDCLLMVQNLAMLAS